MWQFYITWFPTYLIEKRGFEFVEAGRFAELPFLLASRTWIGGWASDRLTRRLV